MTDARLVDLLRRKRDGRSLPVEDIEYLTARIGDGSASDTQVGAFVMAAWLNGLDAEETGALTRAMAASGWQADWTGFDLDGPTLDKHSTGGLGDIVSFLLGPLVAACGGYVPMISGRALEHTGGTIDKLESIPGYDAFPDPERFQRIVQEVGIAIVGQTRDLVPADQRLYAARDVTATVDSLPLITASILSKKVAEGLDGLVMDLKVGNGAFMHDDDQALPLKASLEQVAEASGLPCRVLLTDMNQPLACAVGDAVEMREAIRFLTGQRRSNRLSEVVMSLSETLLVLGGLGSDPADARQALDRALDSGAAAERFQHMVHAMGGPADLLERPESHLPLAPLVAPLAAPAGGRVEQIDARALGLAVHELADRDSGTDPALGLSELVELGDTVAAGQPLAELHVRTEDQRRWFSERVLKAIEIL